jgi:hypothetical protein
VTDPALPRLPSISPGTLIPLGVAASILIGACIVSWRLGATYTSLDERLGRIEKNLNDRANEAVVERDLRLWMMLLKDKNKDLVVPEWVK